MKRKKLFMAALVACGCLSFVSCEKAQEGSSTNTESNYQLRIQGTLSDMVDPTKASYEDIFNPGEYLDDIEKTAFVKNDQISVFGWQGVTAPTSHKDGQDWTVFNTLNTRQYVESQWYAEKDMYYNKEYKGKYTVVGVYPALTEEVLNEGAVSAVIQASDSVDITKIPYDVREAGKENELLWAKNSDIELRGAAWTLPFTHALAKIKFTIKFEGDAPTTAKHVTLYMNGHFKADANLVKQTFAFDGYKTDTVAVFDQTLEIGNGKEYPIDIIAIPQTFVLVDDKTTDVKENSSIYINIDDQEYTLNFDTTDDTNLTLESGNIAYGIVTIKQNVCDTKATVKSVVSLDPTWILDDNTVIDLSQE